VGLQPFSWKELRKEFLVLVSARFGRLYVKDLKNVLEVAACYPSLCWRVS